MEAKAVAKYLRIGVRKVRIILPIIKGLPAQQALAVLENTNKKGGDLLRDVLKSAMANASVKEMDVSKLVVKDATADEGPSFKRIMTRSMGRADRIIKRTTHITVVVTDEIEISSKKNKAAAAS